MNTDHRDPAWHAWKLENLRRSLAMLQPEQVAGLRRDQAIELIEELQQEQSRLDRLRCGFASSQTMTPDPQRKNWLMSALVRVRTDGRGRETTT